MNDNIKHEYVRSIKKNENDFSKGILSKFFVKRKNSDVIFLEQTQEINVQYLNKIKIKIKKKYNNKKNKNKKNKKIKISSLININILKKKKINILKKSKLTLCLSNFYQKKVNIYENIVFKYRNAIIFCKIIQKKIKKKRFPKIKRIIKKIFRFNYDINTHITGIIVQVNGRLSKDRIVRRKTKKTFIKGRFKNSTFLDKARMTFKTNKGRCRVQVCLGMT